MRRGCTKNACPDRELKSVIDTLNRIRQPRPKSMPLAIERVRF